MSEMKVWEFDDGGERDWIAAHDREEAIKTWLDLLGYDSTSAWSAANGLKFETEVEIKELSDKTLDILKVYEEGEPKDSAITFREELKRMSGPGFVASTCF